MDAQQPDSSTLIDASHITISDMGTMNMERGSFRGDGTFQDRDGVPGGRAGRGEMPQNSEWNEAAASSEQTLKSAALGVDNDFPAGSIQNNENEIQALSQNKTWLLVGVSMLVLLMGLIVAFKFRR